MRVHARFTGRVQGVGFRYTTRNTAADHPVSGWVRNEADGSVRMEVQGDKDAVEAFLDDLRARMRGNIHGEHLLETPEIAAEQGFEIRP